MRFRPCATTRCVFKTHNDKFPTSCCLVTEMWNECHMICDVTEVVGRRVAKQYHSNPVACLFVGFIECLNGLSMQNDVVDLFME